MVNSGTKLIFVLLPGVKEFLKQHSKSDKTCAMIKRALEVKDISAINIFDIEKAFVKSYKGFKE